jgi:hypothetical protein
MKKIFTIAFACATVFFCQDISAQCTINVNDTTSGLTPNPLACAIRDSAYGQAAQVHVPAMVSIATVDSMKLLSITGLPAGITYTTNPASGTIRGGANGCIWFSGTTSATVGNYPLTIHITAYTNFGSFDTTLAGGEVLPVCPGSVVASCDTISNLTAADTLTLYTFINNNSGYLSGNNSYGDLEKAEQFSGPVGSQLTGAYFGFGYDRVKSADSSLTVTINAYDATGTGGSPGNTIATTTVTLRQIAAAVHSNSLLFVSFGSPPTLTASTYFISVVLPTTGDTIALLTNQQNSYDGLGWEKWNDNSWNSYTSAYATSPYQFGNYIGAITCGGGPLASYHSSLLATCGSNFTVQFFNNSSNGTNSISWNFPGGTPSSSTSANPTVTYSASGTYHFQLIATGTSTSDTATGTVNVYPSVTVHTSTVPATSASAADGSVTANATTGTPPFQYQWNDTNMDTSATVHGLTAGTYVVTVFDGAGCFAIDTVVLSFNSAIVSVGPDKQVKIYPNPANNVLNIVWNTATSAELTITDMSGRTVARLTSENSINSTFNIHDLSAGTYILHVLDKSSGVAQSVKFVKL